MPDSLDLAPLSSITVERHLIPKHNAIPNTSLHFRPLLVYRAVFPPAASPSEVEAHLRAVGVCVPHWRYTMYKQTHFHSTTHEFLVIAAGRATLLFGGEDNPGRVEVDVVKGDAVLVPAGVGHRLLEGEDRFEMVGAYPAGAAQWDMCYGREDDDGVEGRIRDLKWLERDPLYGDEGPAVSP